MYQSPGASTDHPARAALADLRLVLTAPQYEPWALHGLRLHSLLDPKERIVPEALLYGLVRWKRAVQRKGFELRSVFCESQRIDRAVLPSTISYVDRIASELGLNFVFEFDFNDTSSDYFAFKAIQADLHRAGHRTAVRCPLSTRTLAIQTVLQAVSASYLTLTGYVETEVLQQQEKAKHLTNLAKRYGTETVLLGIDSDFLIAPINSTCSSHVCGGAIAPYDDPNWYADSLLQEADPPRAALQIVQPAGVAQ